MDSVQDLPFLSATTPGSACFNCPNCSVEFRSTDAVVSHLSVEGSCGCWLAHYLPNLHDTENVHYNEDPDAVHDIGHDRGQDLSDVINNPLGDNEDSKDENLTAQRAFNNDLTQSDLDTTPPCIREYHPNTGTSRPGGINHLGLMDQDCCSNIRNTENLYYPFASSSEWELANWLTSGRLSQKDIDWYLHLPHNLQCPPSFCMASDLRRRIESLPEAPQVVKHLFSNLVFASSMDYTPYHDADRAWEIQDKLPAGHSFIGVIGASDKTPLTMGSGNKEMHPLLLSLANIRANVHMKATSHTFALAAYLPISKFLDVPPAIQSVLSSRVFHFAISIIVQSLKEEESNGVPMSDPNGLLRLVHTPLVLWTADLPEQHVITCVSSRYSPISTAATEQFGESVPSPAHHREAILDAIREACHSCDPCDIAAFHKLCLASFQLNGVVIPFWSDWGNACPSIFLTPDALYQWHKFFFDHCVHWVINIIGGAELDHCLSVLQPRTGMRHWRNGISTLKQLSRREHRNLEKLLPVVVAGTFTPAALCALHALTEFIFLTQSIFLYDETLHSLREALREFHHYKQAIIDSGGRQGMNGPLEHFLIPKLELTLHVGRSVCAMGAPYQWSSDITEHCHITHVKTPYHLSNHRNFHKQCCHFLDHQESYTPFSCISLSKPPQEIAKEMPLVRLSDSEPTSESTHVSSPGSKSIFDRPYSRISPDNNCAIVLTLQALPPSPALPFGRANTVLLTHKSYVVAQVQAILQPITDPPTPPLLYIQYFNFAHFEDIGGRRVAVPSPHIEMFSVCCRFWSGNRFMGDIVHLDDVCQVIQLAPKFGPTVPPAMTCDNSLEVVTDFYVNSFADKETFHAILSYQ
ncbi:hypothetical protein V8E55_010212 [Tylopilus felleus]